MNLARIAQSLGLEDLSFCELCSNTTPNCRKCEIEGDYDECSLCHAEYGCDL
jgi:hypothetical protein